MNGQTRSPRTPGWGAVVLGTAAVFGLIVSSGVLAVAMAGFLQWGPKMAPVLDNGFPILVLVLGMLLCGRVAVDMAGPRGALCGVGAALLVGAVGLTVSRSSEAHGDGLEPPQVLVAVLVVLVFVSGPALVVQRRRARPRRVPE